MDQFGEVVFCGECRLSECSFIDDGVGVSGGAGSVHRSCCEVEMLVWVDVKCIDEGVGVNGNAACAQSP